MRGRLIGVAVAVGLAMGAAPAWAAPAFEGMAVSPTGWTAASQAVVSWTQSGLEGAGVTWTELHVSAPGGSWATLHTEIAPTSGPRSVTIDTGSVHGARDMRLVAHAPPGETTVALPPLLVDRMPPALSRPVASHTPAQSTFTWAGEDLDSGLHPYSGQAVEVNLSPAGDEGGAWVPVLWTPSGEVGQRAVVPSPSLTAGRHLVRARATDLAGNEATLALGLAFNDRTPPVISHVVVRPAPSGQAVDVTYSAYDPPEGSGLSSPYPVSLATGAGATQIWEGLHEPTGTTPKIRAYLPASGSYKLVVRVTDRAGNVGSSAPVAVEAAGGAPSSSSSAPRGPGGRARRR